MAQEIAGRDDELEVIRAWLARPSALALVICGKAGIGKTTLWRQAVEDASGSHVLVCAPGPNPFRLNLTVTPIQSCFNGSVSPSSLTANPDVPEDTTCPLDSDWRLGA